MDRAPGLSVRLKLTLSYAGFLMLVGAVLLAAGYFSLSRGVHPGVIFIVRSHADLLRNFAPIAAMVMAFLLVFGLLGGWVLAGRMLAPLARITDATRMAANGSLSHRIRLPGRRDEFRELADASHELRTPLAITQTLLDVARNDPNRDAGELVERLHAVNTRAIGLTEALLLLSRADQRSFTREHVDLSLIAEEATETLLPLAEKRVLTIETAGEKLTPHLVSTLVEPFQRGTERIRTDHAGVGLGLAIVKSITQAHDGTLALTARAAGGLSVRVRLPAAPSHNGRGGTRGPPGPP